MTEAFAKKVELNLTLPFFVVELLIFSASPHSSTFPQCVHLYVASLLNQQFEKLEEKEVLSELL